MQDPDLELLERWRGGDKRAGNDLVRRHFPGVRAYCVNKVTTEYEDLVQETFARLIRARDRFRGEASFRVYLFQIARYVLLEHFRRRFRLGRDVDLLRDTVADLSGERHSSVLAVRERHRLLLDALRQLSFADQELLELYHWQELSAREVGEIYALSEETVRSRVRAAIKRLKKSYAELSAQPHDWGASSDDQCGEWLTQLRATIRVREASASS